MTARQALGFLMQEGILSRRSRVGTFVAPPKITLNELRSFSEEMASRGYRPTSRVIAAGRITDAEIAEKLGLPPDASLGRLQRLRLCDGEVFAVETCYFSNERFSGILRERMGFKSLFRVLTDHYRIKLNYADEVIDALPADRRTARLLRIAANAPVLRISQILVGSDAPVVFATALYRADRHSLSIRRFVGGTPGCVRGSE